MFKRYLATTQIYIKNTVCHGLNRNLSESDGKAKYCFTSLMKHLKLLPPLHF